MRGVRLVAVVPCGKTGTARHGSSEVARMMYPIYPQAIRATRRTPLMIKYRVWHVFS